MATTTKLVYLIIGADRSVRLMQRCRPRVGETAVPIRLTFPDSPAYFGSVDIAVPSLGPSKVEAVK